MRTRMDAGSFDRRVLLERAAGAVLAASALGRLTEPAFAAQPPTGALRALARALTGDLIVPGDGGYDSARLLFNTRFDRTRPLAIAFCANAADVQQAVRWARRHGVRPFVRSGGHSYAGYSTGPGLVIDVSRLNQITVDRRSGRATVGAGVRQLDLYARLSHEGVMIPAGTGATVGIAGLTLGGGIGYSGRKFGLTSDNLRSLRVVTASGAAVTCDTRQHSDLFWASRGGGGGNFGVATSLTFRVHPVANVTTYRIEWPWQDAARVVEAWQRFAPYAPDDLFSSLILSSSERRPYVHSSGQFYGAESALRPLLHELVNTGTPTSVTLQERPFLDAAMTWAGCSDLDCEPVRQTFSAKSDLATTPLPAEGVETAVRAIESHAGNAMLGRASVLLDAWGGAIGKVAPAETAFVHRNTLFSLQYIAAWDPGQSAGPNLAWVRAVHAGMQGQTSGGAYQNYIDPDLRGWKTAYYGSNYRRLVAVKRKYDPQNVFRFRQSIPPRA
jgi:FAD/FMN-containing dehydrogenase